MMLRDDCALNLWRAMEQVLGFAAVDLAHLRTPDKIQVIHSRYPTGQSRRTHDREGEHAPMRRRGCRRPASSIIEKASEYPRPARVLELAQRLGLDLADALARHRELLADLFQRVVGVHADAEAHAQHALLARCDGSEHEGGGLAQIGLNRGIDR